MTKINRIAEAYRLIMAMNTQGHAPHEIQAALNKAGYRNKHHNHFTEDNVRDYIRSQRRPIKNNKPKPKLIPPAVKLVTPDRSNEALFDFYSDNLDIHPLSEPGTININWESVCRK